MSIQDKLNTLYPGRVVEVDNVGSLDRDAFMVYVLVHNGIPIVVGHGKRNRASVIFDNLNRKTPNHLKSLLVRIYGLFYQYANFQRFVVDCRDKSEATEVEKRLHREIGGNTCDLPDALMDYLITDMKDDAASLFLRLAMCSSFDGLDDLRKWRRRGLIPDPTWGVLSRRLRLDELGWD